MRIISKNVSIAIISTIIGIVVGGFIGYGISIYFYKLNKNEIRKELLDSAIIDLAHNTFKTNFPQLHDSIGYLDSGSPWRKLSTTGMDRLYFNILAFRQYDKFEEFVDAVNEVKLVTDDFNDRITLRNSCILRGNDLVKPHNPRAYDYYQRVVNPRLLRLQDYIRSNYDDLVE